MLLQPQLRVLALIYCWFHLLPFYCHVCECYLIEQVTVGSQKVGREGEVKETDDVSGGE